MTLIKLIPKIYWYYYGRISDISEDKDKMILYYQIKPDEKRKISTLEGIFFTFESLIEETVLKSDENTEFEFAREKMKAFEKRYSGQFSSYKKIKK